MDHEQRPVAKRFLAKVLAQNLGSQAPERIFMVSANQGLLGKQNGDAAALADSGIAELESALARDLASENREQ